MDEPIYGNYSLEQLNRMCNDILNYVNTCTIEELVKLRDYIEQVQVNKMAAAEDEVETTTITASHEDETASHEDPTVATLSTDEHSDE